MALWAAGWSFLLLMLFYAVIDVLGFRMWAFPLVVIGMNAITAYIGPHFIGPGNISSVFIGHLIPHLGKFAEPVQMASSLLVMWLVLLYMYRNKTFIRV